MNEIRRILKKNGILLSRVASVNDFNFGIIGEVESFETSMIRNEEEYLKPKRLYRVKVKKGN